MDDHTQDQTALGADKDTDEHRSEVVRGAQEFLTALGPPVTLADIEELMYGRRLR